MASTANIVFSPYNYLLDGKIRGGLSSIKWADAVLVFDEAHNLEVLLLPIQHLACRRRTHAHVRAVLCI